MATKWISYAVLYCLFVLHSAAPSHAAVTWQTFELTNGAVFDALPAVSGTSYVWQRIPKSGQGQIMTWSEGDPVPVIISQGNWSYSPQISDGRIVWHGHVSSSGDSEVFVWANGIATPFTDNTHEDQNAAVGGVGIVWQEQTWNLLYDDGVQRIPLTANASGIDTYPRVMNNTVVWEATQGSNKQIFRWDGATVNQLTATTYDNLRPETDGASIVWYANNGPGGTTEIMRWSPSLGTVQLSSNSAYDVQPDVSGDVVVFARDDGNDHEIMLRYLGVEYQLTNNDYDDLEPAIHLNRVVWQAHVSSTQRYIYYAILSGLDGGETAGACCTEMECTLATPLTCIAPGAVFLGPDTSCEIDSCLASTMPAETWYTNQHDAQRTGRTDVLTYNHLQQLWSVPIQGASPANIAVSPIVGPDGVIYTVDGGDRTTAAGPDGTVRWQANYTAHASPAIRADGNLFLPRHDWISKVDGNDGNLLCGASYPTRVSMAMDNEGNIYASSPNRVYKMSASCSILWIHPVASGTHSHVAIGHDQEIYLVLDDFRLVKLNHVTGDEEWSFVTGGRLGAPAIAADGTIHVHSSDNTLMAVNPDGTEKWRFVLQGLREPNAGQSPAIAADGTVYVVSTTAADFKPTLVAVAQDGSGELWRFTTGTSTVKPLSPVIDGNGTILFSLDGRVTAGTADDVVLLAPEDGSVLSTVNLQGNDYIYTPPAIGPHGAVYYVTGAGQLVALGERPTSKNRYLSFAPFDATEPVGYQVTLAASLNHPDAVGQSIWLGEPDANGVSAASTTGQVVRLWTEPKVHVTGCFIAPVATYEIRAVSGDGTMSTPLILSTIDQPMGGKFWGDVVGGFDGTEWTPPQGNTNIDDAVATIKTWQAAPGAPHFTITDVEPQVINAVVNFNDVLQIILAFQGGPYPYGCPADPCQNNTENLCP